MFFRITLTMFLLLGACGVARADNGQVKRYLAVSALDDSIMIEYASLPPDSLGTPTAHALYALELLLKVEMFRQLSAMTDAEARSVFPANAPLQLETAEWRHCYFMTYRKAFYDLLKIEAFYLRH